MLTTVKKIRTRNSEQLDCREDMYKLQPLIRGQEGGAEPGTAEVTARSGLSRGKSSTCWVSCGGLDVGPGLLRPQVKRPRELGGTNPSSQIEGEGGMWEALLKGGSLASHKRCDNPEQYSNLENGIMLVT